jgi:hypothetical protein
MTQPTDKPADVPVIPNADTRAPDPGAPRIARSTVPARRGLESDAASPSRRHLSRRVRRGEPRDDG